MPESQQHRPERAAKITRRRGRPAIADNERKQQITLRLSPCVIAALRESGEGWTGRVDDLLVSALRLASGYREKGNDERKNRVLDEARTLVLPGVELSEQTAENLKSHATALIARWEREA